MDELSASARHESWHAAGGLLCGLHVEGAVINANGRGGGVTSMEPNGNVEGLVVAIITGTLADGDAPSWPLDGEHPGDQRQLRDLTASTGIDEQGWHGLVRKAQDLTALPEFVRLAGAVEYLLVKHHEVSGEQLQRLFAATRTKGEDMDERPTHDEDGVIEDWCIDDATERERTKPQPVVLTSSNGDEPLDEVKAKAKAMIIAIDQAA